MKKIFLILLLGMIVSPAFASGDFSLLAGYAQTTGNMIYSAGGFPAINTPGPGRGPEYIFQGAYWYYKWWGIGGKTTFSMLEAEDVGFQTKTYANLFTFTAGVPFLFDFDPFAFGIDFYAGYGFSWVRSYHNSLPSNINFGDGPVFDIDAKLSYYLCPSFSVDLKAGYRIASSLKPLDLSSINIFAGINYRFSSKHWPWYDERGCCK
jgi:hypothetical protein